MSNEILFCKKFKVPYENTTISPALSYRARVKLYDYKNILVNRLELTKSFTKTKHFAILKLVSLNLYAYSDTFDKLYKGLMKVEQAHIILKVKIEDDKIIVNINLPNKEYTIRDWGTFYPNNGITDETQET